jgi:type VI secretion system secreted protein Hcp
MRKLWLLVTFAGCAAVALNVQGRLVAAGPLDPPGAPAPSSVTLNELGQTLERIEASRYVRPDYPSESISAQAGAVLMNVEAETQGTIEGGVVSAGNEGAINVLGFSHSVVSPRDPASGLPTGKRQHKPVTITKPVDKSTPLLMNSLVNNENLPTVELRFFQRNGAGEMVQYYTITLTNANIATVESEIPNYESVSFTYQKITWTYEDGGITAEDDWASPVV